jgi:hypothetical protein
MILTYIEFSSVHFSIKNRDSTDRGVNIEDKKPMCTLINPNSWILPSYFRQEGMKRRRSKKG